MESQVVLSSTGMDLLTVGGTPYTLASFGTTTKLIDGVASGSANVKVRLNAAGFQMYGDNETTYALVNSSGLALVDNDVVTGTFTSGTVT